jgi:hypothetical protein
LADEVGFLAATGLVGFLATGAFGFAGSAASGFLAFSLGAALRLPCFAFDFLARDLSEECFFFFFSAR